ncbi:MAG: formate--tetrahydrofolate ligase [Planctomycetes bacterium]|nr:formate--tetrahydrofolate ligase [Planctomycetota bacterium]
MAVTGTDRHGAGAAVVGVEQFARRLGLRDDDLDRTPHGVAIALGGGAGAAVCAAAVRPGLAEREPPRDRPRRVLVCSPEPGSRSDLATLCTAVALERAAGRPALAVLGGTAVQPSAAPWAAVVERCARRDARHGDDGRLAAELGATLALATGTADLRARLAARFGSGGELDPIGVPAVGVGLEAACSPWLSSCGPTAAPALVHVGGDPARGFGSPSTIAVQIAARCADLATLEVQGEPALGLAKYCDLRARADAGLRPHAAVLAVSLARLTTRDPALVRWVETVRLFGLPVVLALVDAGDGAAEPPDLRELAVGLGAVTAVPIPVTGRAPPRLGAALLDAMELGVETFRFATPGRAPLDERLRSYVIRVHRATQVLWADAALRDLAVLRAEGVAGTDGDLAAVCVDWPADQPVADGEPDGQRAVCVERLRRWTGAGLVSAELRPVAATVSARRGT